jgi:hypothetical protein
MTDIEKQVVDILVAHPRTENHMGAPIHAVDRAMGWPTARSAAFVSDLTERGLIIVQTEAIDTIETPDAISRWWWEYPPQSG